MAIITCSPLVIDDEIEVEEEDVYSRISKLDLNEDMTCDEIFEAVFDDLREMYDGQVTDLIVADIAEGETEEICGYFEIEYKRQEWT